MLGRRAVRSPVVIFTTALLVRLIFFATLFQAVPVQRVWGTGIEASNIAASLASGHGFGSPFGGSSGPSAWVAPGYAGMLAVLFKIFGGYSAAAAWSALVLNALFAAATALAIQEVGGRIFDHNVGAAAAWIWVLSLYEVTMCLKIWETSLSALLILTGSLFFWRLRESERMSHWAWWGLFWGCGTLINPIVVIFFPFLSVGAVWRNRKQWAVRLAVAAVVSCAVVGPWVARNYVELGRFYPVRSNFGEELWLGNHDGVIGPNDESRHPLGDARELAAYRQIRESEYVAEKRSAAVAFIGRHPREFLHLTWERCAFFWSSPRGSYWLAISVLSFLGLAIAIRTDFLQALPFAIALLVYPGVYYLTHADNWYRHPIEPVMILLVVDAVVRVAGRLRRTLPRTLPRTTKA